MKNHPAAIRFSRCTAIVSFATAVVIFALYYFTGDLNFAFIGYFAALFFTLIHVIALVVVAVAVKIGTAELKPAGKAILLQLINIPVAVFCFWVGAHLMDIARITFVNETGMELEHVKILGCEESVIDHMDPGESELVWISIPQDCSIRIEYTVNDSTFNKSVYGYLTGGVVYTYPIAGRNQAASE